MATNVISETIFNGKQGTGTKRIYDVSSPRGGFVIKVEVYSDNYDFQSYARAEVWSPVSLTWNPIHSIHYSNMKTRSGLTSRTGTSKEFTADVTTLLNTSFEILGISEK